MGINEATFYNWNRDGVRYDCHVSSPYFDEKAGETMAPATRHKRVHRRYRLEGVVRHRS